MKKRIRKSKKITILNSHADIIAIQKMNSSARLTKRQLQTGIMKSQRATIIVD
ncbi:hypothetical protein IPF86_01350 [Candidatus Nomurabacteria bacterium]|jgi:hypothetical protein|nr:MAG: hypothetical protein IPF86_01350 [Candidatus Nomurabacteria bacterium]